MSAPGSANASGIVRKTEFERKQQIKDVATQLFSQGGYQATSMRDIADAVGLHAGSLYAHIRNKEDMLFAIVEDMSDASLREMQTVLESDLTPIEQFKEIARRHAKLVGEHLPAMTVYMHEWQHLDGARKKAITEKRNEYEHGIRTIIERCVADGTFKPVDTTLAAHALLSFLNWLYQWFRPDGDLSVLEVANSFTAMLCGGLEVDDGKATKKQGPRSRKRL
jgi:AcrR family transcriptional regulator